MKKQKQKQKKQRSREWMLPIQNGFSVAKCSHFSPATKINYIENPMIRHLSGLFGGQRRGRQKKASDMFPAPH